jgi:methyl-accepting chemotaxis protein
MGQDKYIKFILTVIAFSLFWIALNLSVLEFILYDFYSGNIEKLISEVSAQATEVSTRINEFYSQFEKISSRIEKISSRVDEVVDSIKKR